MSFANSPPKPELEPGDRCLTFNSNGRKGKKMPNGGRKKKPPGAPVIPRGPRDPRVIERIRASVKTTMLLKKLEACALGNDKMSAASVRCADILLKKVLPDLAAVEVTGDVDHKHYVVEVPQIQESSEAWKEMYSPALLEHQK